MISETVRTFFTFFFFKIQKRDFLRLLSCCTHFLKHRMDQRSICSTVSLPLTV